MSYEMIALLMFSSMLVMLLTGQRVFGAIGFVAVVAALWLWGQGGSEMAFAQGINFIDTADVYGQDGLSERVIGGWFDKEGRRDEVVLATKFRFTMGDGPNRSGGARYRIVRCVEDSLRRMKTDRIDLYQIHMQDVTTPEEETLRALDDLVRSGKVLYIGCSNYAAYRLTDSAWISRTRNLERYVTLQAQYSLV